MADEIIVVRSLAVSDLGLFDAQRKGLAAKQRAIALTTPVARRMFSPRLFALEMAFVDVICVYGNYTAREERHVGRVGKNWRLGGNRIEHGPFGFLDSKDFAILRTIAHNDGEHPILMTFVGRQMQRIMHAGMGASLEQRFKDSVAVLEQGTDLFDAVAAAFPCIPAQLVLGPGATEPGHEPLPRVAGAHG